MKILLVRTALFIGAAGLLIDVLWKPFHPSYGSPMILADFVLCLGIQTSVPVLGWIAGRLLSVSRVTDVGLSFVWTCAATLVLVRIADSLHNSTIYQPPKPWDFLFRESGIISYIFLIPILGVLAGLITLFTRKLSAR